MLTIDFPQCDLRVIPQTPQFGAIVEGFDARRTMDDELQQLLIDLLMTYKVLILPEQGLDVEEHQRFADRFGEPHLGLTRPSFSGAGAPGIADIEVVPYFHSDVMYEDDPPKWSMLQLETVPAVGGDTMWADLVSAYDDLSTAMKEFLEPLVGVYVTERHYWSDEEYRNSYVAKLWGDLTPEKLMEMRTLSMPHEHQLIRLIPESGKKALWVSQQFTESIVGLTNEESSAILRLLFTHQLQPKYVFRWRWRPGDLVFWDQRTTLHSGIKDYGDAMRYGRRASVRT